MLLFVFPATVYSLLRSPRVQKVICDYATGYLSKELGTTVKVGGINLGYFLDLVVEDVLVLDKHGNTMLYAPSIRVDIDYIDPVKRKLAIGDVTIDGAFFALMKYKNEPKLNLQFILDYFKSSDTTAKESPIQLITLESFHIYNTRFVYNDQNARHWKKGMDYAYLDISNVNLVADAFSINGDRVRGHIHSLSATEKCGFELKHFSAEVVIGPQAMLAHDVRILTSTSDISLDLKFTYRRWDAYNHFIEQVFMESAIRESRVNIKDIGYFAPQIAAMNEKVLLKGHVAGRVDSLAGDHLDLRYGSGTVFAGDIRIIGLPYIEKSWFSADIRKFTTHYSDIAAFDIPDGKGGKLPIEIPRELIAMGKIRLSGSCEGYYTDLLANMQLESEIGKATAEIHLLGSAENGPESYSGHLVTDQLNIGTLLNIGNLVGTVSMDVEIQGSGFTKESAAVKLKGIISSFGFKQYQYQNITVDGELTQKIFNGSLNVKDENLKLDFTGYIDYRDSIPVYDFYSEIGLARLNKLNLISSDSITDVSCRVKAHFQGTTLDNLFGYITLEDGAFKDGQQHFKLDYFKLTALTGMLNYRTFLIKSDYVDATLKGNFYFNDLVLSTKRFINAYLPGVSFPGDSLQKIPKRQNFTFDIVFYNATPVLKYFIDDISVSANTVLKGDFNSDKNTLNFTFNSSEFTYGKLRFLNIESQAITGTHNIHFTTSCDDFIITDSTKMENIRLQSDINNDSITFALGWDNLKKTGNNAADIKGYLTFGEEKNTFIGFQPSQITITDTVWNLYSGGDVKIDSLGINIPGIYFISNNQQLEVKGRISRNPNDKARVRFINFNLSDFDNITNSLDFDFDGRVNGFVEISNVFKTPNYISDLHIHNLGFNGSLLGDATINSTWDKDKDAIYLTANVLYVGVSETSLPVSVEGFIFPNKKKDNFDLKAVITNFQLKSISRYLNEVVIVNSGTASGNFNIQGSFKTPEITGIAKAMRTSITIPYLNTTYAFTHENIRFDKNSISFENLVLLDQPYGDSAVCSGRATHNLFSDWGFNIHLYPKEFLCLNTSATQNDLFYGRGFVSGYAHLYGDEKLVNIDLDLKTERNSQLFLPMEYASTVTENNFITFVNKEGVTLSQTSGSSYAGVALSCKFDVTDEAEVQIIFDQAVGDRIRGRGNGTIFMNITKEGKLTMVGDYNVKSGDYLFTFENVLNKRFVIDEGGTIRFSGDPYNADLDLKAIYHLKASVSSLGFESTKGSIPVDCIIYMTGQLSNPTFTFEIDLPTLNDFDKSTYMSVIEQNLNYNFLTLLVVNSFYNPGIALGGNNSQTAGNIGLLGKTSSEVLSNQMSNWLSQISKDVDIGVNYRPGDQITQQEVELALSTQLFNERVRVESNVGVGGGLANSQTGNSSNIVGDVNVEVKLTDETRLHVFNKSNQQDYFIQEAPYTQGVGVFYRKEFNTFKELFQRKKKKSGDKKKANEKEGKATE